MISTINYKNLIHLAIQKTANTPQKQIKLISLLDNIDKLINELKTKKYKQSRFSHFAVEDPKLREIFAPAYIDRVVGHILIDNINSHIDKKFIFDNYANRKNKGIHAAINRLKKFIKKNNTDFFLQCDIKNFFPSINKEILKKLITNNILKIKKLNNEEKEFYIYLSIKIINQNLLSPLPIKTGNTMLLRKIPPLKSLLNQPKHKGLPIGSLSSQFFSNLYMNELDQFIKHKLKVKYYLRYMDDFILLAENPKILQKWLKEIEYFIKTKLDIELQPKKTILQPTNKGINFLGYIIRKDYILVRRRSIKSLKRSLYFFNHLINPIKFPISDPPHNTKLSKQYREKYLVPPIKINPAILQNMLSIINSYYGIFRFADSFKLRKNIYLKHFYILKKIFIPKNQKWLSFKIKPKFKKRNRLI